MGGLKFFELGRSERLFSLTLHMLLWVNDLCLEQRLQSRAVVTILARNATKLKLTLSASLGVQSDLSRKLLSLFYATNVSRVASERHQLRTNVGKRTASCQDSLGLDRLSVTVNVTRLDN